MKELELPLVMFGSLVLVMATVVWMVFKFGHVKKSDKKHS